jgi:hypothetical protein
MVRGLIDLDGGLSNSERRLLHGQGITTWYW